MWADKLSARQIKRKSGPTLIRITKMRMKIMPLSISKGDKLRFPSIKGIRFRLLYKCKAALTLCMKT